MSAACPEASIKFPVPQPHPLEAPGRCSARGETLAGVQPEALSVEHRVVDDGQSELRVLLGAPHPLGKAASRTRVAAISSGIRAVAPVANRLGAIASTRMPSEPRSRAMVRHIPAMAAFAAV